MNERGTIAIGLLWHSADSGNLGIGALTEGNLAIAREAAAKVGLKPRFTIIGFADKQNPPYVDAADIATLRINTRSLLAPAGYWRTLGKLDCVLDIGGGDSFADIYGAKRFAFLWVTKMLAWVRRVPLLFSPQTIGPFTRQPYRALAAAVMKRAEAVAARDPISYDAIREMAPRARAIQSVDVAFRLPFNRPAPKVTGPIDVGINVSGLLFNRGYSGANEFGLEIDYEALSRALIETLVARNDVRVHLLCHVNSKLLPADDDGRIADRLACEYPGVVRVPDFASPSTAKSFIAGLDFLVAARMHACIAAFSSGVPVVPIAYSRKFAGLFGGVLGYDHIVPAQGMSTAEAHDFILDRLARRQELAGEILRGNAAIETALARYIAELERLFDVVGHRSA